MKVVIMAGGQGQRLWPLSTEQYPKQFLEVASTQSMLIQTIQRFASMISFDDIWIVTGALFVDKIDQLCLSEFGRRVPIIVEPFRKNTGFAITYALKFLKERGVISASDPVLFTPSDQKMEAPESFFTDIPTLEKLRLFAIKPTHPHTGFGYIELASFKEGAVQPVLRFHEKPSLEVAKSYVDSGRYFWNSGIVVSSFAILAKELQKQSSSYFKYLMSGEGESDLPSISFDHLVLEKSEEVDAVVIDVKWIDIGSFDAIFSLVEADGKGNAAIGDAICHDSTENWVITSGKSIALLGMHNTAVIDTPTGLVISSREKLGELKLIKQKLMNLGQQLELVRSCDSCNIYQIYLDPKDEKKLSLKSSIQIQILKGEAELTLEKEKVILGERELQACQYLESIKNVGNGILHVLLMEWL